MTTPAFDTAAWARNQVRSAVLDAVALAHGKEAILTRPRFPGRPDIGSRREPSPLPAITAARHLERAAREAVRHYARAAREDGCTWAEVGEALGDGPDPDAAFLRVASDLGRGPSFSWTCSACLKTVIDYGPEQGHPVDAEHGHEPDCARLAETAAAYEAQWNEGDGENE
jgi:hypothetical protein